MRPQERGAPVDPARRALVRDALLHLNDPAHLQVHRLVRLVNGAAGPGAGRALRAALVEAVDALRPAPETPADALVWRHYRLMQLRYVEGRSVEAVRDTLAISKSLYHRSHGEALDAIVSMLVVRPDGTSSPAPLSPSAASRQPDVSRSAVPAPLTRLIGREAELNEASRLLSGGTRLLTLTGPPGVGKTRLAIAIASQAADRFVAGAQFVSLAAVRDAGQLLPTVARELGLVEPVGRTALRHLTATLDGRQMLLVLDNFEQLIEAAPDLIALLERCPLLVAIVTSRAALRLRGEQILSLAPLPVPDLARALSVRELARYPAVTLFVERARAVRADFALTPQRAQAVAEICRRLDGLPLAIELAAIRSDLLDPPALLALLDGRLDLLRGGARDLPPRHRGLRAAIETSYELLTDPERQLFRRLAIFVGGFTLPLAQRLLSGHAAAEAVLSGTRALLEASLLRRDGDPGRGEPEGRLRMLETVREYALERLREAGEEPALADRHAELCLALASELVERLTEREHDAQVFAVLAAEYDNLRAGLERLLETARAEPTLRLAGALWNFWYERGLFEEGLGLHARALQLADTMLPPSDELAAGFFGAGMLAHHRDDSARARAFHARSLAIAESLGDVPRRAAALQGLALTAIREGGYAEAEHLAWESLRAGDSIGDRLTMAWAQRHLAFLAICRRDLEAAERHGCVALRLFVELGRRGGQSWAQWALAVVALERGDLVRSASCLGASIEIAAELGHEPTLLWGFEAAARLAAARAEPERAIRVAAAAGAMRVRLGAPAPAVWQDALDAALLRARAALGDRLDALWAEGAALSSAAVVGLALSAD